MAGWMRTDNHGTRRITDGRMRPARSRLPRLAIIVMVALLAALVPVQVARAATTFAVNPTGTDSPTCGVSPDPACQTIGYTIANRAANGDTLTLAGGRSTSPAPPSPSP